MDGIVVLGGLLVLAVLVGSIAGLVAFVTTRDLSRRVLSLEVMVRELRQAKPQGAGAAQTAATVAEPATPTVPPDAIGAVAADGPVGAPPAATGNTAADGAPAPADGPDGRRPARPSLEERLGTRWAVWVGGVALGLGGIYLVRYSIEAGLLGPAARVLFGLLLAAVLIGASEALRRSGLAETPPEVSRRAYVPGVLAAAGSTAAFASIYAAHGLYGLIGPAVAFLALGAVGIATLGLALRHGPILAALGLVAAYATPLLVGTSDPALMPLVLYLTVVTMATYAVARLRLWRWLAVTATVANVLWSLVLTGGGAARYPEATASLYVAAHFLLAVLLAAITFVTSHAGRDRGADQPFDRTAVTALSLFGLPLIAICLAFTTDPVMIAVTAITAAGFLALASEWPAARGLAVTALVTTLLAYAAFDVPIGALVIDPVSGTPVVLGFADLLGQPAGNAYLGVGVLLALLLMVGGLWGALHARGRAQLATAGAFAAPGMIVVAYVGTTAGFAVSPTFAVTALAAAVYLLATTEYLDRRLAVDASGRQGAVAAYAIAATAAIVAALTIALERGMLTVALALLVAAIAWVEARRPVAGLRATAVAVAAVVVARFVWDPRVVGDDLGTTIVFNPLLYGYGVPTLAFAYAAWRFGKTKGDPRLVPVFEALAVGFAALTTTLEIHHGMTGGNLYGSVSGLAEQSLLTMTFLALSLGLNWLAVRRPSPVFSWGMPLFGGLGLLMAAVGLLVGQNPWFTGESIAGGPFDATLMLGYPAPALMSAAVAVIASRRSDRPARYVAIAASVAGLLALAWVTLAVRAGWHVGDLSAGGVAEGELYAYSAVWLGFGVLLLGAGIARRLRPLRLVAVTIVIVVVAKVFLIDTADLTGALRAVSLIGLGAVLVGVGLVYQRTLGRR